MKLLVIEDEPSLLNSITRFFRQEQFLCEGVTNYADALQRMDSAAEDLKGMIVEWFNELVAPRSRGSISRSIAAKQTPSTVALQATQ